VTLREWLDAARDVLVTEPERGPQGERGEPGPQGEQGPQGEPGKDADTSAITPRLNEHEARLLALEARTCTPTEPEEPENPQPVDPKAIIVSLTGDDGAGDGTVNKPYRSLAKAATEVKPGGTIYLRGGYYDVAGVDVYTRITFEGTAEAPVTVGSYPGEWAVFDGVNDIRHPRTPGDGLSVASTPVLYTVTKYVHWQNLEVRNSASRGWHAYAMFCEFRGLVLRNNSSDGLGVWGHRCLVEDSLFLDNNSVSNGGESGNGLTFQSQLEDAPPRKGLAFVWPGVMGEYNVARRNIMWGNSDDGMSCSQSLYARVYHCVSAFNGRGDRGDGNGFKMGKSGTFNNAIFRNNLAFGNRANGFTINSSQHVTAYNNTSYNNKHGFTFTQHSKNNPPDDSRCENFGYNNISHTQSGSSRIVGPRAATPDECMGGPSTHENNLGYLPGWGDALHGEDNLSVDPEFLSLDWENAGFLKLGEDSPARGHGQVIAGPTDVEDVAGVIAWEATTDLGAIPYGEEFAGGWDWRAKLTAHFPRVESWPMPRE
jgi:hypothetical protein